jgi:hypothetical protein
MTITINGSGTVTGITAGGLPDAIITQPELATGVAGTGPAFSAYLSANQSMTVNTFTKVTIDTEEFDTASCFNNTGSTVGGIPAYAFRPNVAGYYQVNGGNYPASSVVVINIYIYKNGSAIKGSWGTSTSAVASALIYMNGSTDYIESYSYMSGTTPSLLGVAALTFFQAYLARSV